MIHVARVSLALTFLNFYTSSLFFQLSYIFLNLDMIKKLKEKLRNERQIKLLKFKFVENVGLSKYSARLNFVKTVMFLYRS